MKNLKLTLCVFVVLLGSVSLCAMTEQKQAIAADDLDALSSLIIRQPASSELLVEALLVGASPEIIDCILSSNIQVDRLTSCGLPLNCAIQKGCSIAIIKKLLDAGAHPNAVDRTGLTPLHCACMASSKECIELLLQHNFKINDNLGCGYTLLDCAVAGHPERPDFIDCIKILIESKKITFKSFCSALQRARKKKDQFERRVARVGDTDDYVIMATYQACEDLIVNTLKRKVLTHSAQTALSCLVDHGLEDLAGTLLRSRGKEVGEACLNKLLCDQVSKGNCSMVKLLLDYGVHVNAANTKNKVPLQYALNGNFDILNHDILEILLDAEADPNIHFSNGETPLFHAAKNKDFQLFYKLIECGSDINMPNTDGNTLLSSAIIFSDEVAVPMVKFLLDQGASPHIVSDLCPSEKVQTLLTQSA